MLNLILPNSYAKQIDQSRLAEAYREALRVLGLPDNASVTLRVTNNRLIRQLNHTWRGENAVTDVLSFDNAFTDPETGEQYLGDIVISFQKEIEMLFVHGLLHLAGFDHADQQGWSEMTRKQDQILKRIDNPLLGTIQYHQD